ncbi:C40 family peptidase [Allofournierella massiliensis]|uniref:C40 family peptidase n=1 Tax=Allofournierella massiliensis TaxID=1650663 RepID=A0ABT7UU60_9FIRM|nr:C40 family peptidase [Fournierella massiliensis]MDM8202402.1 C40 family peptidase [Fournierella massiliensis]
MARKSVRLHFTEDELANPKVKKAASRAERAADKADQAAAKTPKKRKLRLEADKTAERRVHLTFEKQDVPVGELTGRGDRFTRSTVSGTIHGRIAANNQDENTAVQAADTSTSALENGARAVDHAVYSKKLKAIKKAEHLQSKSDAANVNALYQKRMAEHPEKFSNPLSRWQQKKAIRKEYAAARRAEKTVARTGTATGKGAAGIRSIGQKLVDFKDKAIQYVAAHPQTFLIIGGLALLVIIVSSTLSSCSAFLPGSSGAVIATTFTADDADIIGANDDYKELEAELQREVDAIESNYPGYDEYNYFLDEIGHDPYQLAAYLTVRFEDYTRNEVQATLHSLFDLQYELTTEEKVEIRYRTETRTGTTTSIDPETGEITEVEYEYEVEVPYEYHILNVTLTNKNLGHVITESGGMNEDQTERYAILLQTKGNKAYLFADDPYVSNGSEYLEYEIPGEALTDERFANMVREAEKYLGYPYVWGGSSPSTSFDCSGFVSYVINHCGNGWDVGRLTANGLKNYCTIISPEEAKPGDLIFFQGTYNTSGASHVGIYVGNGMMLHCGNPISYASINTSYWQQHFYCYGRIPG